MESDECASASASASESAGACDGSRQNALSSLVAAAAIHCGIGALDLPRLVPDAAIQRTLDAACSLPDDEFQKGEL